MNDLFGFPIEERKPMKPIISHIKCSICGEVKDVDSFYFRESKGAYDSRCKPCNLERKRVMWAERQKVSPLNNPVSVSEKRCPRCEAVKSADEFSRFRASKDGLSGWCKPCHRKYDREIYKPTGYVRPDYSKYREGMTIQEFADAAGCSYSHAAKYGLDNNLEFDHSATRTFKARLNRYQEYSQRDMSYDEAAIAEDVAKYVVIGFCSRNKIKLRDGRKKQ